MIDKEEYNRRINYVINRDKSSYLESIDGWRCVLDSFQILFEAKLVKVKYHLVEGGKANHNYDTACKGYALKGIYELFEAHYYYVIPEGFNILFEGAGRSVIVTDIVQLNKIIHRYGDMYLNPSKY